MSSADDTSEPNAVLVGGPHDGTELYVPGLPSVLENPVLPTRHTREPASEPEIRTWAAYVYKLDSACLDADGSPTTARARYRWVPPAVAAV